MIAQLDKAIGGLSKPSKMPSWAWSIPASLCKTGGKLRNVKGSVCSKCYALKGRYVFNNVQNALQRRLDVYNENPDRWVDLMSCIIRAKKIAFFRWFDSGDLQSAQMLRHIMEVAKNCPDTKFWLPTREYGIVSEVLAIDACPSNLVIRLSGYMIDGPAPIQVACKAGVNTSTVTKGEATCPAPKQGNKCLDCRACWDKNVLNVSYKAH